MVDCRYVALSHAVPHTDFVEQLVKADNDETPIAEFHPHKRHFFVFRMSKHAFIEIKPDPAVMTALEKLIGEAI